MVFLIDSTPHKFPQVHCYSPQIGPFFIRYRNFPRKRTLFFSYLQSSSNYEPTPQNIWLTRTTDSPRIFFTRIFFFFFLCSEDAFSIIKNDKCDLEKVLFLVKDREGKGCNLERMQLNQEEKKSWRRISDSALLLLSLSNLFSHFAHSEKGQGFCANRRRRKKKEKKERFTSVKSD